MKSYSIMCHIFPICILCAALYMPNISLLIVIFFTLYILNTQLQNSGPTTKKSFLTFHAESRQNCSIAQLQSINPSRSSSPRGPFPYGRGPYCRRLARGRRGVLVGLVLRWLGVRALLDAEGDAPAAAAAGGR